MKVLGLASSNYMRCADQGVLGELLLQTNKKNAKATEIYYAYFPRK